MARNEFWHGGGRKMRHHDGPTIARQAAAHIHRNIQPDPSKDWMGNRGVIDPNAGEGEPSPLGNGIAAGGGAPMPVGRRTPADLDMD